jgi:hypothetical protein
MSDLNVIEPQVSVADIGHIYRSTYLEQCACIELWADRTLSMADERRGAKPRKTPLLSQKLAQLDRYAAEDLDQPGDQRVFKSPGRIRTLIAQLRPFTDIRSILSHSMQSVHVATCGTHFYAYAPACGSRAASLRLTLSERAQTRLLPQLRSIAKQLGDQRLR